MNDHGTRLFSTAPAENDLDENNIKTQKPSSQKKKTVTNHRP